VVLADDLEQREIARLVPTDVPVFLSDRRDPLSRMVAAVDEFDADAVLCVGVENPFVDPVLIDRLIVAAEMDGGCDYASYSSRHQRQGDLYHLGFLAEWCRVTALRRAHRKARRSADRQDVTRYICTHAEAFRVREVPVPQQLDRDDLRLSIGGEEDWDHAQEVYDALGPECLDWQRIAGLLDNQPALRQRMAVLNRARASA
jgi:spore coat polysaccharide biosynthesis protein SpsF